MGSAKNVGTSNVRDLSGALAVIAIELRRAR